MKQDLLVVFTTIAKFSEFGSSLLAGKVPDSYTSPQTTQTEGRVQYVLVWPYSWQLEHCTGSLSLCGYFTVVLRCNENWRL